MNVSSTSTVSMNASSGLTLFVLANDWWERFRLNEISATVSTPDISVLIDIKPGSDPNCFNINGHGVVPAAILGSADFNVAEIDITTPSLAGLAVRVRGNKGPLCHVEDVSGDFTTPEGAPDGYPDLVCQFEDDPANWLAGDDTADLTGTLLDETPFTGTDSICVVP